jgi:hypothetical protein
VASALQTQRMFKFHYEENKVFFFHVTVTYLYGFNSIEKSSGPAVAVWKWDFTAALLPYNETNYFYTFFLIFIVVSNDPLENKFKEIQ